MKTRTGQRPREGSSSTLAALATAFLLLGCAGSTTPSNGVASIGPATPPPATSSAEPQTQRPSPTAAPLASTPGSGPEGTATSSCPVAVAHTVVPGDTLSGIAERDGVTLQGLLAANPQIRDPELIHAGDRITISPIDLGPGTAVAINNRGQVVGTDAGRAFLWQDGVRTDLGPDTFVVDINDAGQAVGAHGAHAALWQDGTMADLGTLGGPLSAATGINERGQVVGWSQVAGSAEDDPPRHAFLWQDGTMFDLAPLGRPYGGSRESLAINDLGQVVGTGADDAGEQHVYLWDDGRLRDLGPLGPGPAFVAVNNRGEVVVVAAGPAAVAINDRGEIAGGRTLSDLVWDGDIYLWRDGTSADLGPLEGGFLWRDGRMTGLGSLGGRGSWASAINERGQVVGESLTDIPAPHPGELCCSTLLHAFGWRDGAMVDLGTLGPLDGSDAADINDCGQAVGRTYDDAGDSHAVLWQTAPS